MLIVNLTPHAITLVGGGIDGDENYTVQPHGDTLRLDMPHTPRGWCPACGSDPGDIEPGYSCPECDMPIAPVEVHGIPVVQRGRPSDMAVDRLNATLRRHLHRDGDGYTPVRVLVPILVLPHVEPSLRPFVFAPDTGPGSVVRDDTGRITGVRRLVREPGNA